MSQILAVLSTVKACAGAWSPDLSGARGGDLSAVELSTLAVSALVEEAELTPKPALVDRRGSGAHHNLDLARLRRSAQILQDGFAALARAATGEQPSLQLREQIGRIGRDME